VANHTPGPWKPFRTPRMLHGVMGWRRKVLCRMEDHGVANIEAEAANARLMAAAILYYEATQVMLANEQSGGDGWWRWLVAGLGTHEGGPRRRVRPEADHRRRSRVMGGLR
jgi:hypothetical protein